MINFFLVFFFWGGFCFVFSFFAEKIDIDYSHQMQMWHFNEEQKQKRKRKIMSEECEIKRSIISMVAFVVTVAI